MTKNEETVILDYYCTLYKYWLSLVSNVLSDDEYSTALTFLSAVGALCDELGLDTYSICDGCLNGFLENMEAGA